MFLINYDDKLTDKQFENSTLIIENIVQNNIRDYIDIPKTIMFFVSTKMNLTTLGRRVFHPDFKYEYIEINAISNRNIGDLLLTTVHELYHSYQAKTGKLGYELVDGVWKTTWEGSLYEGPKKYKKLPWEIEAHEYDYKIAREIAIKI